MTVTLIAEKLHVTRPAMSHLFNGKADQSPLMEIRFEKGFGMPADTMLGMQTTFDLRMRAHTLTRSRWSASSPRKSLPPGDGWWS